MKEILHGESIQGEQDTRLLGEEIGEPELDLESREFYAFFLNSSLVSLALEIDAARSGQITLDVGLSLGIDTKKLGQSEGPLREVRMPLLYQEQALSAIQNDPEFKEFWQPGENIFNPEENHFAQLSKTAYAEFLAGDPDTESKIFVVGLAFRKYIIELNNNSAPGPIFQRVLRSIQGADEASLRLIAAHYPSLAQMDEQYFWIASRLGYPEDKFWTVSSGSKDDSAQVAQAVVDQFFYLSDEKKPEIEYGEACKRAFERFSAVTDEILSTAFDSHDTTPWREFLAKHFELVAILTSIGLEEINAYDPSLQLERLKKIADASEKKDWDKLADYVACSEFSGSQILKDTLDRGIIAGNPQPALTYVEAFEAQELSIETSDEWDVFNFWAYKYAAGEISEAQFLKIPEGIKGIKDFVTRVRAYSILPSFAVNGMREMVWELAKEEPIYEDGLNQTLALIEKALSAGIFPTEAIADLLFDDDGWEKLEKLQRETQNGNFDPENKIQRDIEFMKYLRKNPHGPVDYEEFAQLPFVSDPEDEPIPILDVKDRYEARACCFRSCTSILANKTES